MRNQGRGMGRGLRNGLGFPNGLRRGAGNGFGGGRGRKVSAEADDSCRVKNTLESYRRRVRRNDVSCLSDGPGFGKGLGRGNGKNRKFGN